MLFYIQFGKHTIMEANVDHYKLPCIESDTNLWAWWLVSRSANGCGKRGDYCKSCRCVQQGLPSP